MYYIDTETTGLFFKKNHPFLLQYGDEENIYLKYLNPKEDVSFLLERPMIFFNAKFDLKMLIEHGHLKLEDVLKSKIHDVYIQARLEYDRYGSYQMKNLAAQFFGEDDKKEQLFLKKYMREHGIDNYVLLPKEIIEAYAKKDIELTRKLYHYYIGKYPEKLYQQEMDFLKVLLEVELDGMRVDVEKLDKWIEEINTKLITMKVPVSEPANENKIAEWLFKVKGFKSLGKTKIGKDRTDVNVLEHYSSDPEVAQLLKWKKLHKLSETFLKSIKTRVYGDRVYMQFNQSGAVTGRMSCSTPNLQNLPSEPIEGYDVRSLFLPDEGCKLVSIDLSQIEIRVFALYAMDKKMLKAIEQGQDFHQWTANLLNIDRKQAKTINFGTIYGMGVKSLAEKLGVSNDKAKEIRYKYYATFPAIRTLNQRIKQEVMKKGYIYNFFGRRYYLFSDEAYKGLNRLIQGTSADLFKHNVLLINRFLKENGYRTKMKLFIHDEIVFNVPEEEMNILPKLAKLLADNTALNGRVKLEADISKPMEVWQKC